MLFVANTNFFVCLKEGRKNMKKECECKCECKVTDLTALINRIGASALSKLEIKNDLSEVTIISPKIILSVETFPTGSLIKQINGEEIFIKNISAEKINKQIETFNNSNKTLIQHSL
jgi:hypothetical protein